MKIKVFLYLGLLATTAVWGGAFLVMKDSLVRQDVYSFLASRFILAAAFMFMYKPKSLTGLDRKFVKRAVLIGLLLCSGFIFQTFGLTQTTVSNTGFITGLYLVFTPLISWLLLKREIFKVQWLAVLVATIGLYFISFNGISVGIGEILVLISALLFAGQIVALGEWSDGENTYALTLIQILVSAVIFFALSLKDGFQLPPDNAVWSAVSQRLDEAASGRITPTKPSAELSLDEQPVSAIANAASAAVIAKRRFAIDLLPFERWKTPD